MKYQDIRKHFLCVRDTCFCYLSPTAKCKHRSFKVSDQVVTEPHWQTWQHVAPFYLDKSTNNRLNSLNRLNKLNRFNYTLSPVDVHEFGSSLMQCHEMWIRWTFGTTVTLLFCTTLSQSQLGAMGASCKAGAAGSPQPSPSGTRLQKTMENHHVSWVNQVFL